MIGRGYAFMTQKNPGDIGVYGTQPQISTLEKGLGLVAQTFGIQPETLVNFSQLPGAPGKPIPLKDILRERPIEKTKRTPERKSAVKADKAVAQPAAEPEPEAVLDPSDPEREKYVQSLQGKPVVQNVPLSFGMEVDLTYRQVGVLVSHIIPGGPAALAGLEAGDRITKLQFETSEGSWGPYAVKTLAEFKRLRSFMQPNYTVGVWYIRGGLEDSTGIRPKAAQSTSHVLTNTQNDPFNRAWSAMEKDREDLSSLTIGELAQYHQIEPKQVAFILNKLGARAKDYVPNEQQPNERDPASVTGNLPANTSALT
jgi:hypothetical protein